MEVLSPWYRRYCVMGWKIATLNMAEKEAKTDYIRHIAKVKAHVPADKVKACLPTAVSHVSS